MLRIRYLTMICSALAIAVASVVMPRAAEAGGSCHPGRGVSDARGTTVTMTNNCFVATVLRVDEGATVTFLNKDEALHSVTGVAFTWGDETPIGEGETIQQVFDENGVYVYTCLLHPGMAGAIIVGDGSGAGPATASIAGEVQQSLTSARGGGGQPDPAATASAEADAGTNSVVVAGVIAGGVALLLALVAGSMLLARSSASRRADVR